MFDILEKKLIPDHFIVILKLRVAFASTIIFFYTCDFSSLRQLFCNKRGIEPNWKIYRKAMEYKNL